MATILEGLNQIAEAVGGTAEAESNLEALNAISAALGGSADAENNADAIANIAENASGGGGGGSSDFSTATVTVVISETTIQAGLNLPNTLALGPDGLADIHTESGINESAGTKTVILYQGTSYIGDPDEIIISTSGNIEDWEYGYLIKGDCTLTVKKFAIV